MDGRLALYIVAATVAVAGGLHILARVAPDAVALAQLVFQGF